MDEPTASVTPSAAPRWRPISAIDRRILGVLIEKAKTTPDAYPMSVNALRSGVNQKNNRYPLMELEIEDVDEGLERLRALGAVTEVQGSSRVSRYRHHLYEWLGADKIELAVMAELLLRGAQTEGELRGRAARMDPIPDLSTLRTILQSLEAKGLIVSLTPKGRGYVLTHALYEPRELEKVRAEFGSRAAAATVSESVRRPVERSAAEAVAEPAPRGAQPSVAPTSPMVDRVDTRLQEQVAQFREEIDELRGDVTRLRREMDELLAQLR